VKHEQNQITLIAQQDDDHKRFDKIVRKLLPELSLSMVYALIRKGVLRLNNQKAGPSDPVAAGDRISMPAGMRSSLAAGLFTEPDERGEVRPSAPAGAGGTAGPRSPAPFVDQVNKLKVFESRDLLVLNKPRGMLVHGENSLARSVERYWRARYRSGSLSFRPGPVHRLDRNTSGLQIFSLSLTGARILTGLFKSSHVNKIYIALAEGNLNDPDVWKDRLARDTIRRRSSAAGPDHGREALTEIIPVYNAYNKTCVLCLPRTGRTHQIRAQAALHGHPLAGDKKYGSGCRMPFYVLHAAAICVDGTHNSLHLPVLTARMPDSSADLMRRELGRDVRSQAYAMARALLEKPAPRSNSHFKPS
jgi:23S rRNA pseudouridine955/2504/2580 synthase